MVHPDKQLLDYFARLPTEQQQTLLAFAEFLAARHSAPSSEAKAASPQRLPRPAQESVVAAIKRLSASYPMLDKPDLLNETSVLMSQHVLQGRTASAVIDELETLFDHHYQQLQNHRN